jgi:hypothetical protein
MTTGKGKHQRLLGFRLTFNKPLDSFRARIAANYTVTQTVRLGKQVVTQRVKLRAQYDPGSNAVTLVLSGKPSFGIRGEIDVNAAPPTGITDTSGGYLVGGPLSLPGIDPVISIRPKGRGFFG